MHARICMFKYYIYQHLYMLWYTWITTIYENTQIYTRTLYVWLFQSQNAPAREISESFRPRQSTAKCLRWCHCQQTLTTDNRSFKVSNMEEFFWSLQCWCRTCLDGKFENPVRYSTRWGIRAETGCLIAGKILIPFNRISAMDLPKML